MTTKWNHKLLTDQQLDIRNQLAEQLNIDTVLAQLLVQREITDFDNARAFFRPDLRQLHDPFLMADMDKAVKRLEKALENNEKILVYGDYDVDGTTSVSLVYSFLKKIYNNVIFYIPDRYTEGYGVSYQGIDYAAENSCRLIITLDCGIKAIEKVRYASAKGIDFIICDHHTPDAELPPAVAVLDPKRADCEYPYKHLSGCGVGFKLLQAFCMENDIDAKEVYALLDLVALSIASDIVPMNGENRILAHYGLEKINRNPSIGIKSIINTCGLQDREITISDIVFKIGPRINASGRIKRASEAVDLLVSQNPDFAREKSNTINVYNNDRKDLDKTITEEAIAILSADPLNCEKRSTTVYKSDWHKGVVGIVASRLTEEFFKPTIVLTESNGLATGSARSVAGFDLYRAIDSCRDLLENFGGHTYAAGLSMKPENVTEFTERFEKFVAENILEEQTYPQIDIDAVVDFKDITPKFVRILKQFAPFGPDNMKPVFVTKNVKDSGQSRLVGKEQEHLKLSLVDSDEKTIMNGIAFGMGNFNNYLKTGKPFDICYTIEENNFNNSTYIQLMIRDIKESADNW
jgi:single-stranded-DNA-specific exonuclease RecJ